MHVPELRTDRLLLRAWRDGDDEAHARICSDEETMRCMLPPRPLTQAEAALDVESLREHWRVHGFGHWASEELETGRLVGRTGVNRHDDWPLDPLNTEVGWLYDQAGWGRGFATEGALAAIRSCFEELDRAGVIRSATRRTPPRGG